MNISLEYHGNDPANITPPLPAYSAIDACDIGTYLPVGEGGNCYVVAPGVMIQRGGRNAVWVRFTTQGISSSVTTLQSLLSTAEGLQPSAIYISFPEVYATSPIPLLKQHGFSFHHFHPSTLEFIYAKPYGPRDIIHPYTTGAEGVGVVLLSPDEKEVRTN